MKNNKKYNCTDSLSRNIVFVELELLMFMFLVAKTYIFLLRNVEL